MVGVIWEMEFVIVKKAMMDLIAHSVALLMCNILTASVVKICVKRKNFALKIVQLQGNVIIWQENAHALKDEWAKLVKKHSVRIELHIV